MNITKRRKFSYIHSLQSTKNKLQQYFQDKQSSQQSQKSFLLKNNTEKFDQNNSIKFSIERKRQAQFKTNRSSPYSFQNLSNLQVLEGKHQIDNKVFLKQQNRIFKHKRSQTLSHLKYYSNNKIKKRESSFNISQNKVQFPVKSQYLLKSQRVIQFQKFSRQTTNNHCQRMHRLQQYLTQDNIFKQLGSYSKQKNRKFIRVYKQQLQKLIAFRYGKDSVSGFLNIQYILDLDSIMKIMKQLLHFQQQEVLLFSFFIFDQNRDGLVTPDDILNIIGGKRQNYPTNSLIMLDIHKIMSFIQQNLFVGQGISQKISLQYKFSKDQTLTLKKFRQLRRLKSKKQKIKEYLTKKMNLHLYTLQDQSLLQKNNQITPKKQQNKRISNSIVVSSNAKLKNQIKKNQYFTITFQSYKKIFKNTIPHIFMDFLYLLGGLQVPQHKYTPLDVSILTKPFQTRQESQKEKGMEKIKRILRQMKEDSQLCQSTYQTIRKR